VLTSLSVAELTSYVAAQVAAFLPDGRPIDSTGLRAHVQHALERTERCFARVRIKNFASNGRPCFNHLHTDQYAMFLYLLSNTVHRAEGDPVLASKLYGLNKALHAIDVFYEVELPEVFFFQHPVGTVLGRAVYGNGFVVYQRCSTGSNLDGAAPVIGEGVVMFGGSAIIGRCTVGANAWLSVGTIIMDADVPADSVAFGQPPRNVFKPSSRRASDFVFLH
jgi:serine O-acetyltransferase